MEDVVRPMNSACHFCIAITCVSWSKDSLYGIPWQLIRHLVIAYIVVLAEELRVERQMCFWNICLFLCVFTGWDEVVSSHFVEDWIIVTDIRSFLCKIIICQCPLLMWFVHPLGNYIRVYFPTLIIGLHHGDCFGHMKMSGCDYAICTQGVETFNELCD